MTFAPAEIDLPIRLLPKNSMSDEDVMRFCAANEPIRIEREPNGEILVMTPANSKTGKMNLRIGRLLDERAEADGRGVAFDSSGGFTLPDTSMRNPDAAWMLNSRWSAMSDEEQSSFAPACPDFIELRSPTGRLPEIKAKMEQWIANGAQVAWLIDPSRKAVEVYRPAQQPEIHENPTSIQGTGPIAGFEPVMNRIWN